MPLGIQGSDPARGALHHLAQTLARLADVRRQLASGTRLGRAADNPAALVAVERLSAEVQALQSAVEGAQRTANLLQTADAGLVEAGRLLDEAQGLAVQAADGSLSAEARGLLQEQLNGVLSALSRIAGTTRFAGQPLLSGGLDFALEGVDAAFRTIDLRRARFPDGGGGIDVSVEVTAAAAAAQAGGVIAATQTAEAVFEVSGPTGATLVTVAAGATRAEVAQAVNAVSDVTGVVADETTGAISSRDVGSAAFVEIRNVSGVLEGVAEGRAFGTDIRATVNGVAAAGRGNTVDVSSPDGLTGAFTLREGTGTGTYVFRVVGGGVALPGASGDVRISFGSARPEALGAREAAGGLSTLAAGGANSLFADPAAAARILASAADDVARLRGSLGGVQRHGIESAVRAFQTRLENMIEARSRLGDTDVAEASTALARETVKLQAQRVLLRQTHALSAQRVLTLLGG